MTLTISSITASFHRGPQRLNETQKKKITVKTQNVQQAEERIGALLLLINESTNMLKSPDTQIGTHLDFLKKGDYKKNIANYLQLIPADSKVSAFDILNALDNLIETLGKRSRSNNAIQDVNRFRQHVDGHLNRHTIPQVTGGLDGEHSPSGKKNNHGRPKILGRRRWNGWGGPRTRIAS